MLRHSRGLPGLRAGLRRILACCGLALLFSASPSFAQSTAALKKNTQATSPAPATQVTSSAQQTQLEGELQVLHEDDFKNKKSRTRHFLKTASGERYELKFKGRAPHHLTGTKLRVRGAKTSDNLLALDSGSGSSVQVLAAAPAPNTFGEQKVAVLLVNFANATVQPFTTADANNVVFNSTNSFYKENSFQQTWLTGSVFGWFTLPIATTCDTSAIADAAKQAATAAGVNLAAYNRYVYVFPSGNCGWSGMASIGGNPSEVWINGNPSLDVIGHELGHNFGLYHSHWLYCDTTTLGSSCLNDEYGDPSDIMGNKSAAHFNTFQKERLGWLNNGVMPPITTVSTDGTYTLEPYETTSTNPKALKILKSVDATTGAKTWYYIEYRQPLGFDSVLTSLYNSNMTKGVQVRIGTDPYSDGSSLLDMNPNGPTVDDNNDSALVVGQSYTDSAAGFTLTTAWADAGSAGVTVSFNSKSCMRAKPSVVISPAQGASVAAGTPVAYTVAVTNNDSSACGTSMFNMQASVPAGWSASYTNATLTISPASAASTTLTVTSAGTAVASTYTVGVTATNSVATSYNGTASATYVVGSTAVSNLAVALATDKTSYIKGEAVTMTGLVTGGGGGVAGAGVTFTVTKPNGATVNLSATTDSNGKATSKLRLNKQKDPVGTYQLRSAASANGQTATANMSFTVQ